MADIKQIIQNTIDANLAPSFSQQLKSEIVDEILSLYTKFKTFLDQNWLERFSRESTSRAALIELAFLKHYATNSNFKLLKYSGASTQNPDFEIITSDNKHYLIELTSMKMPNHPDAELVKAYDRLKNTGRLSTNDYNFGLSVNEFQAKLTQAIKEKSKYAKLASKEEKGVILFISFGEIPFGVKPDTYHLVHALYGLGEWEYYLDRNNPQQVKGMGYTFKEFFENRNKSKISNQYLFDNPWLSAVILSAIEAFYLFNFAKPELGAYWNSDDHQDFVLVHNPLATIPLAKGIFPVKTELSINDQGNLVPQGSPIFPDYSSIFKSNKN